MIRSLLAAVYRTGVSVRNGAFDRGLRTVHAIGAPVISVGNITTGGTGKTPMVEYLLRYCQSKNMRGAVVTRGYRRKTRGQIVVSDGRGTIRDVYDGGDEPVQIARKFPEMVVIADEKRVRGCVRAVETFHADCIILDDGYQHRSCGRNLDVVVVDADIPLWNQRLLPAGRLREPIRNLGRADVILLSHCRVDSPYMLAAQAISAVASAPVLATQYVVQTVRRFDTGDAVDSSLPRGKKIFAFCGIGSPASFRSTLDELGVSVEGFLEFPDHHYYSVIDISRILGRFLESHAEYIVTTEKDVTRLLSHRIFFGSAPLIYPEMTVRFLENEDDFLRMVDTRVLHDKKHIYRESR